MAEVILADLVHPYCPRYRQCLEERVNKVLSFLGNRTSEPVYFILQQHAGCAEDASGTLLLEKCVGQNGQVHVLTDSRSVAVLYAFKQAVDELNVRYVHVITCSARRAELQECEKQLFTELYSFTYSSLLDCSRCPFTQFNTTCLQLTHLKKQICDFLQHLPAVKGEITVLKSSLIAGEFLLKVHCKAKRVQPYKNLCKDIKMY